MQLMMEAREMDLSRGEIRSLFDQTRSEQNTEVEQILTPTQYADYLALPQDNFGGGRRGGGFGGSSNGNSSNGNSNNGNSNNGNSNNGNSNNGNNGGGNSGGGRSGGF
jgi:hypothetical protein